MRATTSPAAASAFRLLFAALGRAGCLARFRVCGCFVFRFGSIFFSGADRTRCCATRRLTGGRLRPALYPFDFDIGRDDGVIAFKDHLETVSRFQINQRRPLLVQDIQRNLGRYLDRDLAGPHADAFFLDRPENAHGHRFR